MDGYHIWTWGNRAPVNNAAEFTFTVSTGVAAYSSTFIVMAYDGNSAAVNSHKVAWKALIRTPGGDRKYLSGGYGTAPTDPADPAAGFINITVKNNLGYNATISVYVCSII